MVKGMSVTEHYDRLLAEHYSWMLGPFADRVAEQRDLLSGLGLAPGETGRALDLGCGSGIQSVALAQLGFDVTAVDTSRKLLDELDAAKDGLPITTMVGDIEALPDFGTAFDAIVCMGDTLTHLSNVAAVERLFDAVTGLLSPGGRLVLTFRDLTAELAGTDRFIPVRSDSDRIMTCFLEYEPETVVVHDLVHVRQGEGWDLNKSSYRKLRLSPDWVRDQLTRRGFRLLPGGAAGRMMVVAAQR